MQQAKVIPLKANTGASTLTLMDECTLQIFFFPNQKIGAFEITEMLNSIKKIGNGKKFKSMVIVGENSWPDMEAVRLCCSTQGSKHKVATAFVIKNAAQRIVGKLLMSIAKPKKPTRFFSNEELADNWLQSLSEN